MSILDEDWMRRAIGLALFAQKRGEVPVGAVLVSQNKIVGEGWNCPILRNDPTAHAEIMAIRHAASELQNYRLPGTTLYTTLEPCSMCVGAMIHARIERLVFAAHDSKIGAAGSVFDLAAAKQHNHRLHITGGMLEKECVEMLREFFRSRRAKQGKVSLTHFS